MKDAPADPGSADDIDELYRRAAALDPEQPSESARRRVMNDAAHLASRRGDDRIGRTPRWRRPAVVGTLAAASVAGLLVVPRFLGEHGSGRAVQMPVISLAAAPAAKAPAADAPAAGGPAAGPAAPARVDAPQRQAQSAYYREKASGRDQASGVSTGARDENGRTALLRAVLEGRAETVDSLLAAGADPNAADRDGITPLQAARAAGRSDIADALRRAGAR